ncbi:hypothetical protein PTI98_013489 [Pleurotus ostreatus]|nr:hypothetical protein PTI98_013489 [Pleurotus ostreatus]
MVKLPPEIWRIIFANVQDKQTLCNILATSRQFGPLAEPSLYARIVFPASSSATTVMLENLHKALSEAENSRRPSYIRTLSLSARGKEDRVLIDDILAKTANLKHLQLHVSPFLFPRFFRQGPPFNLTGFYITLSSDLFSFLGSHATLETLYIAYSSRFPGDMPVFSSTSFPNLKSLTLISVAVDAFLGTAAPIRQLRLQHSSGPAGDAQRMLSVRVLSCPSTDTLSSVFSLFPDIEWLELFSLIGISTLMDCQYPNLRGIRLPRVLSRPQDMYWVFDALPTLVCGVYEQGELALQRLYRGAIAPTMVQWLCGPGKEWLADWEEDVVHIG